MKYFFLFFIFYFSTNVLASTNFQCHKYELENDEEFILKKIGSDTFLAVHSKNFDINFFLQCPIRSNIYAKIINNGDIDKDSFLQIETELQVDDINILNYENTGSIKEIKFSANEKPLASLFEENIIHISINGNKDMIYDLSKTNKNKLALPLNFQCSKEYFFNKYRINSLSFENKKINIDNIVSKIEKWKIRKNDNQELASWFTNCKRWINLNKNNNLEDLYSIDKQIAIKSLNAHKASRDLLIYLQERAISNEKLNKNFLEDFANTMNALKVLEKDKSKYDIFKNINNVFYIKNDKYLNNKLNHILSYEQNSYYYDLLSNATMGSFRDVSNFKLDFTLLKINVFALSKNKNFLVILVKSRLNLSSKNTQFTTYKLSNSFCSFLNNEINTVNKKISKKIDLVEYCYNKNFGSIHTVSNKSFNKKPYIGKKILQKTYITSSSKKKKSECKKIDKALFCKNILKKDVKSHMKNGLRMPSLDELIDSFDDEKYEGATIYAPNNKYFFFDEDSGWVSRKQRDSHNIDLILIR